MKTLLNKTSKMNASFLVIAFGILGLSIASFANQPKKVDSAGFDICYQLELTLEEEYELAEEALDQSFELEVEFPAAIPHLNFLGRIF